MEPNQELVDYIKARKEQGANMEEITNELKGAGWDEQDISVATQNMSEDSEDVLQEENQKASSEEEGVRQKETKEPASRTLLVITGVSILIGLLVGGIFFANNKRKMIEKESDSYVLDNINNIESGEIENKEGKLLKKTEGDKNIQTSTNTESNIKDVENDVFKVSSENDMSRLDGALNKLYSQETNSEALEMYPKLFKLKNFNYSLQEDSLYYYKDFITKVDLESLESFYGVVRDKNTLVLGGDIASDEEVKEYGIDRDTFQVLGEGIFRDKDSVFCKVDLNVGDIDADSFKMLKLFSDYAVDKNYAYYNCNLIEGADVETFEVLEDENGSYAKDAHCTYIRGESVDSPLCRAPKTLNSPYSRNKEEVYWHDEVISGADSDTFETISSNCAKDKNNVYFGGKVIEDADIDTFESLHEYCLYSKDKNYVYQKGEIIEDVDPAKCTVGNLNECVEEE
ncbi:MAG: DKNYY domain-containing protein [Candidatus Pacebacteria bacterium]|nr:DKNYY domain-containing protein [Candidatus Paceibacterota bacterium]